jgi:hypothetical protein
MRYIYLFMILVILLIGVHAVNAQDALTPTLPPDDGGGGGLPIDTIWDLLGVIVAVGSTITFTVVGIAYALTTLIRNTDQMAIIEQAFDSVPAHVLDTMQEMSTVVIEAAVLIKAVGELVKEATDRVPVKDKLPVNPDAQG